MLLPGLPGRFDRCEPALGPQSIPRALSGSWRASRHGWGSSPCPKLCPAQRSLPNCWAKREGIPQRCEEEEEQPSRGHTGSGSKDELRDPATARWQGDMGTVPTSRSWVVAKTSAEEGASLPPPPREAGAGAAPQLPYPSRLQGTRIERGEIRTATDRTPTLHHYAPLRLEGKLPPPHPPQAFISFILIFLAAHLLQRDLCGGGPHSSLQGNPTPSRWEQLVWLFSVPGCESEEARSWG